MPEVTPTHQPDWEKEFDKTFDLDAYGTSHVMQLLVKAHIRKILSQERSKWQAQAREQILAMRITRKMTKNLTCSGCHEAIGDGCECEAYNGTLFHITNLPFLKEE